MVIVTWSPWSTTSVGPPGLTTESPELGTKPHVGSVTPPGRTVVPAFAHRSQDGCPGLETSHVVAGSADAIAALVRTTCWWTGDPAGAAAAAAGSVTAA